VKRCNVPDCANQVVKNGLCTKHCPRCEEEGCQNAAMKGGVCKRHAVI
jgi:hypothetical protein